MQANTPIPAIIDHSTRLGLTQINGTTREEITQPTNPVINNVNNGDDYHQTYFISETPTFENRIVWFEIS